MPTLDTFQSIFLSILNLSQQSRITQQVGMTVLAGYVLKKCTGYRIIRLLRMFQKSSVDLNGPPNVQRSDIYLYGPLSLATCFVLLIHIFHIILQVVLSFNVTESHYNLEVSK